MTIKETRKMHRDDLQEFCIKHNYFTKGDNKEYEKLLSLTKKKITPKVLYTMAGMIAKYSKFGDLDIECLMHNLTEITYSFFDITE